MNIIEVNHINTQPYYNSDITNKANPLSLSYSFSRVKILWQKSQSLTKKAE